jgi:hypothetical protein
MPATSWGKLDQLAGHHFFQAVNSGDAVAHRNHRADLGDVDRLFVMLNLLAENAGNLVRSNLRHILFRYDELSALSRRSRVRNWPRTEPSYTVEPMRATTPPISDGIDRELRAQPLVAGLFERRDERRALRPGQLARRSHLGAGEPEPLIENLLEGVRPRR